MVSAGHCGKVGRWLAGASALLCLACVGWTPQQSTPTAAVAQTGAVSDPAAIEELKKLARRKLLTDEADHLVVMANELKVDVDKTNKNILSLEVIRKAEQIEVLARHMKGDTGKH